MSKLIVLAGSVAALALVAACGSSGGGSNSGSTQGAGAGASSSSSSAASSAPASVAAAGGSAETLAVTSTSKGMVLTANGRAVYTYDPDTATSSMCTGACATAWPPVEGTGTAGTGATAADITTITRPDGSKQLAYNGHPIYFFSGDTAAGQVNGNGVDGTWHVITTAASGGAGAVTSTSPSAPAPSSSSSSKASGGGGYGY
jgi:predicted lipoprotein with Yx(FWY)xxD motif